MRGGFKPSRLCLTIMGLGSGDEKNVFQFLLIFARKSFFYSSIFLINVPNLHTITQLLSDGVQIGCFARQAVC